MITYYDRSGSQISPYEWQKLASDKTYTILSRDETDVYAIVTIWNGIDYIVLNSDKSRIFQTTVYKKNQNNSVFVCETHFSTTEEKAIECHRTVLWSLNEMYSRMKERRIK